MPLLRTVARTTVIAGTASAVSGRVQHRQQGKWAAQEEQQYAQQQAAAAPAPAAAPAETGDPMQRLAELGELHKSGVLTDEEFAVAKAKILNG